MFEGKGFLDEDMTEGMGPQAYSGRELIMKGQRVYSGPLPNSDKGYEATYHVVEFHDKLSELEPRIEYLKMGPIEAITASKGNKWWESVQEGFRLSKQGNFGLYMREVQNAAKGNAEAQTAIDACLKEKDFSKLDGLVCRAISKEVKRDFGGESKTSFFLAPEVFLGVDGGAASAGAGAVPGAAVADDSLFLPLSAALLTNVMAAEGEGKSLPATQLLGKAAGFLPNAGFQGNQRGLFVSKVSDEKWVAQVVAASSGALKLENGQLSKA